jgi:hypothetical protein
MKTAGQTICDILRQSFPGSHCDLQSPSVASANELRLTRRFYPGLKSLTGHYVRPYGDLDTWPGPIRYFTFLRDPIQRCASHYQFMVSRNNFRVSFVDWIRKNGGDHQTRYFTSQRNADAAIEVLERKVGFVGLVERFDESLVLWRQWANEAQLNIRYRSRNIAADNRIKQELLADSQSRALLEEFNGEDVRLYQYARDVIYPRQLGRWGHVSPEEVAAQTTLAEGVRPAENLLAACKRNLFYKPLARTICRRTRQPLQATCITQSVPPNAGSNPAGAGASVN